MKRITISVLLMILGITAISAQNINPGNDHQGTWKFDAPYAPEGYKSGILVVGKAEQKPTATMSFTGSEYILNGERIKIAQDSILFSVSIQGEDINVGLKVENETKMSGKAVFSEGEVPVTLTKSVDGAK